LGDRLTSGGGGRYFYMAFGDDKTPALDLYEGTSRGRGDLSSVEGGFSLDLLIILVLPLPVLSIGKATGWGGPADIFQVREGLETK
jgi:hypothetical protein